jgi:large subunit ribosomal protein L6
MSRIGKSPVIVKGKLGALSYNYPSSMKVDLDKSDGNNLIRSILVAPSNDNSSTTSMWGTVTTTIRNMVTGVSEGYSKTLIVNGTGYRSFIEGDFLRLSLGYSHDIIFAIASGILIRSEGNNIIVSGYDKQKVGQICGEIISHRPVEPYKGKGIYISGSRVRRKEGKKK